MSNVITEEVSSLTHYVTYAKVIAHLVAAERKGKRVLVRFIIELLKQVVYNLDQQQIDAALEVASDMTTARTGVTL